MERASVPTVSPFQRLNETLAGIEPGLPPINLALGEPRHGVPAFVAAAVAKASADFGRYPPISGSDAFRRAVATWIERRYHLASAINPDTMVIALSGSREGLFSAIFAARARFADKTRPVVLLPNPFYQAYGAAAEAIGAETVTLAETASGAPDLAAIDGAILARTIACYVASPSAPQGAMATLKDWMELTELARRHRFMLFADECYSEIYRAAPPAGALEGATALGGVANVVSFNSLSKRSNLPGLRVGFAAGDADFLAGWLRLRNMAAPQVPLPLQAAAVAAYQDEEHVLANRRLYNEKYELAERALAGRLGYATPPGGFFLWLDMAAAGGGEAAAIRLWREAGLRTLPGEYLARPDGAGRNPGAARLRIAMVEDLATTKEALNRLSRLFP